MLIILLMHIYFLKNIKTLTIVATFLLLLGVPSIPETRYGSVSTANFAQAQSGQDVLKKGVVPEDCVQSGIDDPTKYDNTKCGFLAFLQLSINLSQLILGIVGSLALLFFIYGGLTFLTSAGSAERISQGKRILVASVIGIAIVFSSYVVIHFIVSPFIQNWQEPGGGIIAP